LEVPSSDYVSIRTEHRQGEREHDFIYFVFHGFLWLVWFFFRARDEWILRAAPRRKTLSRRVNELFSKVYH